MRIATFNIQNRLGEPPSKRRDRLRRIAEFIRPMDLSVICLQEVFRSDLEILRVFLKPAWSCFSDRVDSPDDGEGLATLRLFGGVETSDVERFWLSETPGLPSVSWGASQLRIATACRMTGPGRDGAFRLYNVHLDHRSRRARTESLVLLRRRIRADREAAAQPVILCGDFNLRSNLPAFQRFLEGGDPALSSGIRDRLLDTAQNGPGPIRPTYRGWGRFGLARARLDYCLHTAEFETVGHQVIDPVDAEGWLSDHCLVRADLRRIP